MDSINQPTETSNPPSDLVTLPGLLDRLTALADETAMLPPPLGLFATELEAGLAEALAVPK